MQTPKPTQAIAVIVIKPLRIAFSSTRQWNPGDEFILRGAIRAFSLAGFDVVPLLFNRNPQIRPARKRRLADRFSALTVAGSTATFVDNSIKDSMDLSFVDAVVFAGSPQWRGTRLRALYQRILEADRPTLFLGIGTNRSFSFSARDFSADEMAVMHKSRLITCRDSLTARSLAPLSVHQLACPAFLAAEREEVRDTVRRVGLIFGSDRAAANNGISAPTFAFLHALYTRLIARYGATIEFEFVAHYIDELPHFQRTSFSGHTLRYSYDSRDYADIYSRYDLVVGHRVHGIGIAASQGIPGICIVHDLRGETARAFGAKLVSAEASVENAIELFDESYATVEARSRAIIAHKRAVEARYLVLLREALDFDTNPR